MEKPKDEDKTNEQERKGFYLLTGTIARLVFCGAPVCYDDEALIILRKEIYKGPFRSIEIDTPVKEAEEIQFAREFTAAACADLLLSGADYTFTGKTFSITRGEVTRNKWHEIIANLVHFHCVQKLAFGKKETKKRLVRRETVRIDFGNGPKTIGKQSAEELSEINRFLGNTRKQSENDTKEPGLESPGNESL